MKSLYTLVLLVLATTAACNKHNVPLGGACDQNEDCGTGMLGCYKPPGQDKGYCSTVCQVNPSPNVISGGTGCESAGLVCKKADTKYAPAPGLGLEFCVKP